MTTGAAPVAETSRPAPWVSRLAGTASLLRLAGRRDRILVPSSVLGLVVLAVGSAQATLALYPTDAAASQGLGALLANPSVVALYGPLPSPTADALAVVKTVMMGAFLTAVLGFVVVRRHTRTEEDEGRFELLGSGVVGRWAPLVAAVALASAAVLAAGVLSGLGLAALGMDPTGSAAFAIAWLTAGLATVGVSAVVVQLASTSRGAAGLGFGFLAAAFAVRAAADSAASGTWTHALGWVSPLGWAGRVEPYGADRLWVLGLGLATLVGGVAAGVALLDRRDLGAGLLPVRVGPRRAAPALRGPLSLVVRLARGTVIGWGVGMVLGGVLIGSLLGAVADMGSDPAVRDLLEKLGGATGAFEDVYVAAEVHVVAAAVAGMGVALVLRLVSAERTGLGELVLAAPTARARWFGAHVILPVVLSAGLMAVLGLAIGLVGPTVAPAAPGVGACVGACLAVLPAVWVVVGVATLLAGARPRLAPFAWGVLLVTFLVSEVGPLIDLPTWLLDLSPFTHLSSLPAGSFEVLPAVVLTAVAAALVALGVLAYRRRDAA